MSIVQHRRAWPRTRAAAVVGLVVACLVATAAPAQAAPITLPAGEACQDFPVTVDIRDDSRRISTTYRDRDGNDVTVLRGLAESVLLTNADTGRSVTLPSRAAVTRVTTAPDGTQTIDHVGPLLLVLFSTDVGGAGLTPTSTTLVRGRTVYTVSPTGVFTVNSIRGTRTDLCAALA